MTAKSTQRMFPFGTTNLVNGSILALLMPKNVLSTAMCCVCPWLQIQDTVAICPGQLSQHLALAALQQGGDYVRDAIAALGHNRQLVADALSPLGSHGEGWVGGDGAIYYFAKLPDRFGAAPAAGGASSAAAAAGDKCAAAVGEANAAADPAAADPSAAAAAVEGAKGCTDEDVVAWLIREHGVCVIPGSACGMPGWIRVAYANVSPQQCEVAAARLKKGLQQLLELERVPCMH
jgi:katanin p60 ATPase-containing subunit A1